MICLWRPDRSGSWGRPGWARAAPPSPAARCTACRSCCRGRCGRTPSRSRGRGRSRGTWGGWRRGWRGGREGGRGRAFYRLALGSGEGSRSQNISQRWNRNVSNNWVIRSTQDNDQINWPDGDREVHWRDQGTASHRNREEEDWLPYSPVLSLQQTVGPVIVHQDNSFNIDSLN